MSRIGCPACLPVNFTIAVQYRGQSREHDPRITITSLLHSIPRPTVSRLTYSIATHDPRHSLLTRQHSRCPRDVHRRRIPLYRRKRQIRHSQLRGLGHSSGCMGSSLTIVRQSPSLTDLCHLSERCLSPDALSLSFLVEHIIYIYHLFSLFLMDHATEKEPLKASSDFRSCACRHYHPRCYSTYIVASLAPLQCYSIHFSISSRLFSTPPHPF